MLVSLSPVTVEQMAATRSYWKIETDPLACDSDTLCFKTAPIVDMLRDGRNVLAFTRRPHASAGDAQQEDAARTAQACAALLRDVVRAARPQRIGIAGGDTSSHAVQALDAWGLSYRAPLTAASPCAACTPTSLGSTAPRSCSRADRWATSMSSND
ncbi:nucleotide-binding domain containing protein [Paraburkholderia hospita]|uniref:nucleotide-binding domain containing protein n=1 Tax=Paraburkholderia hospita TaxID=169430 RepID=UPI001F621A5F|nr:nucleotide-binding domain containing protein [Paraburkholderia hospita]